MQHSQGFLKLVQDAKSHIEETDVVTVKQRMDAGEPILLIDVREESEWDAGHIPGAIHLGRGILERDIERLIPDHAQEIILYCGGGYRSALSAENLKKMGYERPVSMDGGAGGWRAAGLLMEID